MTRASKVLMDEHGYNIAVVRGGKDFELNVLTAVKEHYMADKVRYVSNNNEHSYGIKITTPDHEWTEEIILEDITVY